MKTYDSYHHRKDDQTTDNQKRISALEHLVLKVAPHLTTSVKRVMYIHAKSASDSHYDYVQLGFYQGATLDDLASLNQCIVTALIEQVV